MIFTRLLLLLLLSGSGFLLFIQTARAEIWSYDGGQNNQDEWGVLDKNYTACESGTQQSPVQIGVTKRDHLPPLILHYGDTKAHLQQKDYTLVVDIDGNLTLSEADKAYRLVELRFHTPSEHVVLGRFWPLEIQLMHRDNVGKMLIISVFAESGQSNPALQTLLDHVDDNSWLTDISFNPQALIPPKPGYYAYTGSLTIPPCTEGIEWRILKEPITVSQNQIVALEKITHRNARVPQPVYMRTILETGE